MKLYRGMFPIQLEGPWLPEPLVTALHYSTCEAMMRKGKMGGQNDRCGKGSHGLCQSVPTEVAGYHLSTCTEPLPKKL